jgi:hypothetical protein
VPEPPAAPKVVRELLATTPHFADVGAATLTLEEIDVHPVTMTNSGSQTRARRITARAEASALPKCHAAR